MDNQGTKEVKIAKNGNRRPPNAGIGRKKGTPNKTTQSAKEAIAMAADKLGGADRLVKWVKEAKANERVFWGTIYPKLLPLQVSSDPSAPLVIQILRFADEINHS